VELGLQKLLPLSQIIPIFVTPVITASAPAAKAGEVL